MRQDRTRAAVQRHARLDRRGLHPVLGSQEVCSAPDTSAPQAWHDRASTSWWAGLAMTRPPVSPSDYLTPSAPDICDFRRLMAGLCVPLPTFRRRPHRGPHTPSARLDRVPTEDGPYRSNLADPVSFIMRDYCHLFLAGFSIG